MTSPSGLLLLGFFDLYNPSFMSMGGAKEIRSKEAWIWKVMLKGQIPNMSGVALKDVSSTLFCIVILLHGTSVSH
jgi:hypothetical protein